MAQQTDWTEEVRELLGDNLEELARRLLLGDHTDLEVVELLPEGDKRRGKPKTAYVGVARGNHIEVVVNLSSAHPSRKLLWQDAPEDDSYEPGDLCRAWEEAHGNTDWEDPEDDYMDECEEDYGEDEEDW